MYIIRCAQSKAKHVCPDEGDEVVVLCGSAYDVVITTTSTATV